jgi:hypothetical protein
MREKLTGAEAETEIVLTELPNERPILFKLSAISGVGKAKKRLRTFSRTCKVEVRRRLAPHSLRHGVFVRGCHTVGDDTMACTPPRWRGRDRPLLRPACPRPSWRVACTGPSWQTARSGPSWRVGHILWTSRYLLL